MEDLILHIIKNIGFKAVENDFLVFDKNTKDFQLLPNFRLHEFLTKNTKDTYTRIHIPLLVELQDIRTRFGSGVRITSTYRSEEYNKSQNGATSSQHLIGKAIDSQPINGKIDAYKRAVKEVKKRGGIGYYKTFVHIDSGRTRTWEG